MSKQSHWLICGYDAKLEKWLIVGNMKPQLTPNEFYKQIEPHRYNFVHFGVWVVPHDWEYGTTKAPKEEVKSIDEIFRDIGQIKDATDILEGMVFTSSLLDDTVLVLAEREGYVMCKGIPNGTVPKLIHWRELLAKYELTDLFE